MERQLQTRAEALVIVWTALNNDNQLGSHIAAQRYRLAQPQPVDNDILARPLWVTKNRPSG